MKYTEITCDICHKKCILGRMYGNFIHSDILMDANLNSKPVIINEDYCDECVIKIIDHVKELKKCQAESIPQPKKEAGQK